MATEKIEPEITPVPDRIRWEDEEAGRSRPRERQPEGRRSLSLRRTNSRHRTDPALALPIQYRTVSFQIEESKAKDQAELQRVKNTAVKDLSDLEWHTLSAQDVAQRLNTSPSTGLSFEQAERRIKEYGKNEPSPPETHYFWQWFGYFFKGFGAILLVGAILVFVSWKPLGNPPAVANLALAIVLLAVFFIQAAFTMFQDWSTSRVMSSIKNMLPEESSLLRDARPLTIAGAQVVPGDIVRIKAGNKLPADIRVIEASSDARFDRSVLTGESKPVAASVECTDSNYLETRNIGLQGTHCLIGSCVGIVVATGDRTVFGRIAKLTNTPKTKMTSLEREILYFVIIICSIMLTMVIIVIVVWAAYLRPNHPDFIDVPTLIVNCVSVAIAFIPEGLPIALTAGLTITANLMRKSKVLCKSLKTVETLGAVSVVCSDKTGTLTEGKMTVTDCLIGGNMTIRDAVESDLESAVSQVCALATLCNGAELDYSDTAVRMPIEQRPIFGDATDTAILRFAEQLEKDITPFLRSCWTRTFELAFNSKNKFMIRSFRNSRVQAVPKVLPRNEVASFGDDHLLLTIKGAPDVLITRCSHYVTATGVVAPLGPETKTLFEEAKNRYSSQGKRCILLARKILSNAKIAYGDPSSTDYEKAIVDQATSGLTLVGLVAIVDPLRPEIVDVVSTLRGAGVRIAMVTGDFALTALAIARDAGIVTSETVDEASALARFPVDDSESNNFKPSSNSDDDAVSGSSAIVISGPELMGLNEQQWASLISYKEIVFARTTPEQKLRIVMEYQGKGNVVAMTGDGVNDAPSLKAADVGISMGSGSDIAMEAADMVLLESFSSVVTALQYGRVVFDNLKKVISYLLPAGSFAEFWPVMASVCFGLPQILSSFLMIIICCFTDCAAATMLSYEKPEADVLFRPPRNIKRDRLVNWQLVLQSYGFMGIFQTFTSFAMSFWYLQRNGIPFSQLWFAFGAIPEGVDEDYYVHKVNEASSIYFVNLVVMQWFNLMTTRTRRLSIVQHPPLFNKQTQNWYLFPAILFSLGMAIMWLYIPSLHEPLGTTPVPVEHWFLPFSFGIFIVLMDEARKFAVRKWPKGLAARVAW